MSTPKKRKGRVVAMRIYRAPNGQAFRSYVQAKSGGWNPDEVTPMSALPADAASVERMVEQMSREIHAHDDPFQYSYGDMARAALAAIGITAKGGKRHD